MVRYADPRTSQLQAAVDDLIQQGRLVPGQLIPLLRFFGVGQVLLSTDTAPGSGASAPLTIARSLAGQLGNGPPAQTYGRSRIFGPPQGRAGTSARLPDIERISVPGDSPGIVRLQPSAGATILDGDGNGIAELAADGELDPNRALMYSGDTGDRQLAQSIRDGATLVITDSNRRRVIESNRLQDNLGPPVGPTDPLPREWPSYDLFPKSGSNEQTVALYSGLRYLRAPSERGFSLLPEHRAFAALDGNLSTSWVGGSPGNQKRRYIELGFKRPRDIGSIRLYPLQDPSGLTNAVSIAWSGGHHKAFFVHSGWNTLRLNARNASFMRLTVRSTSGFFSGPGGISELQVPGLTVHETLRTPLGLAARSKGFDLRGNPISVLLSRTTADFPGHVGTDVRDPESGNAIDMVDAEYRLERDVTLPTARSFLVGGWASVSPTASDSALDRLTGLRRGWRFTSSSRFEGVAANRASSAFDGTVRPWIGDWIDGQASPWIEWRAPRPVRLSILRLQPGPSGYGYPTKVVVTTPNYSRVLPVDLATGLVRLGRSVRTDQMRITMLSMQVLGGAAGKGRLLRAVALREIRIRGLDAPAPARSGTFQSRCGTVHVNDGASSAIARVSGSIAALDAGQPLRITSCGSRAALAMPANESHLSVPAGRTFLVDHLALTSPAPTARPAPTAVSQIFDPGHGGVSERRNIKLSVAGPSWLVLAESYSPGWHAWCKGTSGHERSLGAATPIDGFANGWRVDSTCGVARIAFTPQSTATLGYWISAIAGALLLLVALAGFLVRPGAQLEGRRWLPLLTEDPPVRLALPKAVAAAVALGTVCGFVFAIRVGALVAPLTLAALVTGVTVRRLFLAAGAALLLVPLIYVIDPAPNFNGFSFIYAIHHISAHWFAVVAVIFTATGCFLSAIRRRRATLAASAED